MQAITYAHALHPGDMVRLGSRWHIIQDVAPIWRYGELTAALEAAGITYPTRFGQTAAIDGCGLPLLLPEGEITALRCWQATQAWLKATSPNTLEPFRQPYEWLFTELTGIPFSLTIPQPNTHV